MNSVHDMGGMHGFGPVEHEENEPTFHEPWHGRLFAMQASRMVPLFSSTDAGRHALERLDPAEYLGSTYYERWLKRMVVRLVELVILTQQELDARVQQYRQHPSAPVPRREDPAAVEKALDRVRNRQPASYETGPSPSFRVGDAVRTKNQHPKGHTRLPRYARGRVGTIGQFHGFHDLADTLALGEHRAEALYSVRFDASELWGDSADGKGCVLLDLWDSYLEPADSTGRSP